MNSHTTPLPHIQPPFQGAPPGPIRRQEKMPNQNPANGVVRPHFARAMNNGTKRTRSGTFGGRDMAVDLGTANTIVYLRGHGIVLDEPSVVAIDTETGKALAVGAEAKRMVGRTPSNITATNPLEDGVIADFDVCEKMLRHFISQVCQTRWPKPRLVICVPSGITGVEQRAVLEAAVYAGARKVYTIEEPMAAAIGAGLPVQSSRASMIVDIGGGTTEVAVISLGGLVSVTSLRVGGKRMDAAISALMRRRHNLSIGERTAESIKLAIGSAWPLEEELQADVSGVDVAGGLPKKVVVSSGEIRESLNESISSIIGSVKETLDQTPADLAADVLDYGITLTGGGALLPGIDQRIEHETGVPTFIADEPLYSVVMGSGQSLEEFETLQSVMMPYTSG